MELTGNTIFMRAKHWLIAGFFALSLGTVAALSQSVSAQSVDTSRDCDQYAVMYCGAMTKTEIIKKLNEGDGRNSASNIQSIYNGFGLNASKISSTNFVNGVVYQNGEVKVGSKVVATGAKTHIRTMGTVSASRMGSAQSALVALDGNGKFLYAIMTPCGNPVSANPVPVEQPKPAPQPQILECVSLSSTATSTRNQYTYTAKARTANGATIESYTFYFGDGQKKTITSTSDSASTDYTYQKDGNFNTTVEVTGKVDGKTVSRTSSNCASKVTVAKAPAQKLECVQLTATPGSVKNQFNFNAKAMTENGATITSYTFTFGDGTTETVTTSESTASIMHTYAQADKYVAKVTVNGAVDGKDITANSSSCETIVNILPDKPAECKPGIPVGDERCAEKQPEVLGETVTEMPKTGPAALLALFGGTSALGAIGHRFYTNRRNRQ